MSNHGFAAHQEIGGRLRSAVARILGIGVLVFGLAGCLQVETLVQVKPDGSGTIVERFLMGQEIVAMFAQMAPEGETFDMLDEEQLREDAANYGPGVTFESAESLQTDFGQGYLARYSFEDISQIKLEQDPSDKMPEAEGMQVDVDEGTAKQITFDFQSASPSELIVHWPVEEPESGEGAEAGGEATGDPDPGEIEMMKAFFKDMRITMAVEIIGEILETNATHRDGSTITLVDFAFGEMLADENALKTMMMEEPKTVADMKEMAKSIAGLKMEFEPEVKVVFE